MKTVETTTSSPNSTNAVLPAVAVRELKKTIKNLREHVEDITGIGCTFWACDGHESMKIKAMVTCDRCRSIIIAKREIKRLELLVGNGR